MAQTLSARWRTFIEERLLAFSPTLDINSGSPAYTQVIEPLLRVLSPDFIESDLQAFLLTRLQQAYPEMEFGSGSALSDTLVKPSRVLLEPIRRENRAVRNRLTLKYPSSLLSEEADELLSNLFFTRDQGSYATVTVRIRFQNPVDIQIGSANVAYTASGLRFLPTRAQRITAAAMLMNLDGDLYYFDTSYRAERPGTSYNIEASAIIGVRGIAAARSATNLLRALPGDESETTSEFVDRAQISIGERSLNTVAGVNGALFPDFDALRLVQVVGFNDDEMERDVLVGGSLGAVVCSDAGASDGTTSDDGDADGYTPFFDQAGSVDFTVALGPVGTDLSSYTLVVETATGPVDYVLGSVIGATRVRVSSAYAGADRLADSLAGAYWHIRQRSITLSSIPGGILFPDVYGGTTLDVPTDTIHVGGCTDIYVRGNVVDRLTVALPLVSDEAVIARREDARTILGSAVVTLQDLTAAEWALIVEGRTSLYLEQSPDQGAYRVIEKVAGGPPYQVRLGQDMTATTSTISFLLVDDVDINLVTPREMRYTGSDLRTVAGLAVVETVSGVPDFGVVGVVDTDLVRILNGSDAGEYSIVAGGVAGNQITLQSSIPHTASPLQYEIYRKLDGIDLPLLRVTQVELLDSSLTPTGSYVPYRHPVDIRSFSFQNPGNESKAGTAVDVTLDTLTREAPPNDDVVTSSLPVLSLDYWALGVRPGDIVNVLTSDNQGFYTVLEVGGDPASALSSNQLRLDSALPWAAAGMEYVCGAPSYGSFRLYFLEPLTIWMDSDTARFVVDTGVQELGFRPSPTVRYQYLPTLVTVPTVTLTPASGVVLPYSVAAVNLDLMLHELELGDRVEISYAPLVGSEDLIVAGALNLDGLSIQVDVGYGAETVVFSGTALGIDAIITQINNEIGYPAAGKYEPAAAPGTAYLMLRADRPITILDNSAAGVSDCTDTILGVNRQTFNPWLPPNTFAGTDTDNDSPEKGFYLVSVLAAFPTGGLTLTDMDGGAWVCGAMAGGPVGAELGHYVRISRLGLQRIGSTQMLDRGVDELGLYYWDVECVSEGHGNQYNIPPEYQATLTGYESEGWALRTEDVSLAYSMAEVLWMDISPRVLIAGADDDPTQKEEITGQSIQVSYEQDAIVEQIHDYVRALNRRITCHSPLVRALLPTFIRTEIQYRGGDTEENVRAALIPLIESTLPDDQLELSALVTRLIQMGATKITYPVTLFAVLHRADRTIWSERSEDAVSTSRLNALIADGSPDGLTSYIGLTRSI